MSAHSGALFGHATAPVDFTCDAAVVQFGGYFATNGGADGGLVEFFDRQDQLIAAVPLDATFQAINGFVGYDDMEGTFNVPGAPAALLLLRVMVPAGRRR